MIKLKRLLCKHHFVCSEYQPPFLCIGSNGYVIKCRKCGKIKCFYDDANDFINIGDHVRTNKDYRDLRYLAGYSEIILDGKVISIDDNNAVIKLLKTTCEFHPKYGKYNERWVEGKEYHIGIGWLEKIK